MKYTAIDSLPATQAYLHFEADRIDDGHVQVDYELVIPLNETDCRGTWDHKGKGNRPKSHRIVWLDARNNRRIPLGRTIIGTTNAEYPFSKFRPDTDEIDLPFRDGAHQMWDNDKLGGLPVIYTMGDKHWKLLRDESRAARCA